MNKTIKILTVVLMLVVITMSFSNVFAEGTTTTGAGSVISGLGTPTDSGVDSKLTDIGKNIINYIWVASIIISVIVVMVLGIKYIIGSTAERAEYKKSMIPLVVGVLLVVLATTIVNILFSFNA